MIPARGNLPQIETFEDHHIPAEKDEMRRVIWRAEWVDGQIIDTDETDASLD
jgi:hypothetical protein